MQVAISLLFAGALGNFIDRLVNGEVVDFVDTNIFLDMISQYLILRIQV